MEDGDVRMVIGKLFQMRGAVELKARLANTVFQLLAGTAVGGLTIGVDATVSSR